MALHNSLTGADIHVSHFVTYANAAARQGAIVSSADVGKIALQSDNGTYYVLVNNTGPVWNEISNPLTTKGDLIVSDGTDVLASLGVGPDGYVLTTDSGQTLGVKWAPSATTPFRNQLRLDGANGYGSSGTDIRRYTTVSVNTGSDWTYADSATVGMSVTINNTGIYAIMVRDNYSSNGTVGISVNSTQLSTPVYNITPVTQILATQSIPAAFMGMASWTGVLSASDVVRAHCDGVSVGGLNAVSFEMWRINV